MTFDQLVAEVLARTRQTSDEAKVRIGREVNDRYRRVTTSIGLATTRRATVTAAMTAGDATVLLAGEKVLTVFLEGTHGRILAEITFDTWRQRQTGTPTAGVPVAYAVGSTDAAGVTIHLTPVPDADGPILADVLETLPDLVGAAIPSMPASFHDVLLHGALADEWLQLKQDDLTRAALGAYEARLADLRYFIAKSNSLAIVQGGRGGYNRGDYLPGYSVPPPGVVSLMASRAVETGVLRILDGSHGLSDWYPPRVDENQLCVAWDVEFWNGTLCGRRHGSIDRAGAAAGVTGYSLYVWTPTTKRVDDRLAMATFDLRGGPPGFSSVTLWDAAWAASLLVTLAPDALDFSQGVDWASLHGKLFIATKSTVNRLHVYSPSYAYIRPTGLAPLPGGQVAAVGFNGTPAYTDPRSFRVRMTRQVSGVTTLRSEPSFPVTPFTPLAGHAGAQIQLATAGVDPWATHWELEELAGGEWYRTQTVALPTVQANTSLPLAQVPINGVLSEDTGDYALQYSARYLTVDEDRLILGGSFDEEGKSARVSWSALGLGSGNGQVGVGNDERLPADVDGFLDFDMLDGGGLTGIKAWEGKVIVFKRSQVHQMVRSSSRVRAYLPDTLSRRHGAIPFSIVEGTDAEGLSCLYFLDPEAGPMQLGFKGLRVLAPNLQRTWRSNINLTTATAASVTYHAEKRQVWWHVATGNAQYQNIRWMYSVESDGMVFHTLPALVKSATAWQRKPHLLFDSTPTFPTVVGQGDEPSMVVDYTDAYRFRAYVVTKAYQLGALLRRFQIGAAVLEAEARTGATVGIGCRRDFGVETRNVTVALTPATPVSLLVLPVDNSYMTEAITMQFEVGDLVPLAATDIGAWQIHGLTLDWSLGSPTTGRG